MFTEPAFFTQHREKNLPKWAGLIFTIIYLVFFILAVLFSGSQFLDTKSPNITLAEIDHQDYPEVDIVKEQFGMTFALSLPGQSRLMAAEDALKYISAVAAQVDYLDPLVFAKGEDIDISKNFVQAIPCKNLSKEVMEKMYGHNLQDPKIKGVFLYSGLCFDSREVNLKIVNGLNTQKNKNFTTSSFVFFGVRPCDASKHDCKQLAPDQQFSLSYSIPRYSTNFSNKNKPFATVPRLTADIDISPQRFVKHTGYFKKFSVLDSRNYLITEDKSQSNYLDIFEKIEAVNERTAQAESNCQSNRPDLPCVSYFSLRLAVSSRESISSRKYKGLFETIGDIGGVQQVLWIILLMLYKLVCICLHRPLVRHVFEHKDAYPDFIINSRNNPNDKTEITENQRKKIAKLLSKAAKNTTEDLTSVATLVKELLKVRILWDLIFDRDINPMQRFYGLTISEQQRNQESDSKYQDCPLTDILEKQNKKKKSTAEFQPQKVPIQLEVVGKKNCCPTCILMPPENECCQQPLEFPHTSDGFQSENGRINRTPVNETEKTRDSDFMSHLLPQTDPSIRIINSEAFSKYRRFPLLIKSLFLEPITSNIRTTTMKGIMESQADQVWKSSI